MLFMTQIYEWTPEILQKGEKDIAFGTVQMKIRSAETYQKIVPNGYVIANYKACS